MGRTERIAYIQIRKISQLLRELLSVLCLFLAAETGILKQDNVSLLHVLNCLCRSLACYIVIRYENNLLAELLGQSLCNGCERLLLVGTFLYLAEVGAEDYPAAVVNQLLNGRQRRYDSRLVRNLAVLQRYVEVTSYQNSLSLRIDIINRFLIQTHFCPTSVFHHQNRGPVPKTGPL